ncbi:MAG: glycosyltransferase, partial [Candidatus Methanomethylicus sp.]|nr:glycosyltransferase [Candidatus Methanomethylicus sp.]
EHLQHLAKEFRIEGRILFTGPISSAEAHVLFSRAVLAVFPYTVSYSASGTLPMAVQHKKPIVASKTPYLQESLQDGINALMVEPGDAHQLAKAIERLLDDATLRTSLGQHLYEDWKGQSWDEVARLTWDVYLRLGLDL